VHSNVSTLIARRFFETRSFSLRLFPEAGRSRVCRCRMSSENPNVQLEVNLWDR